MVVIIVLVVVALVVGMIMLPPRVFVVSILCVNMLRLVPAGMAVGMTVTARLTVHDHPTVVARGTLASWRTSAIAAPKPLSMFTTVTPAAQLDNMPSRAASPPKDAP
jgi:hypothetical protein